jgi:hypothetical protein
MSRTCAIAEMTDKVLSATQGGKRRLRFMPPDAAIC